MKEYKDITVKELQEILNSDITDKKTLYDMYVDLHNEKLEVKNMSKYSKSVIIKSERFKHNFDLLSVLLDDDKEYTIQEVLDEIDKFKNRKIEVI